MNVRESLFRKVKRSIKGAYLILLRLILSLQMFIVSAATSGQATNKRLNH
jgi:hypothetical protein